jgi:hypothetical protein
MNEQTLAQNVTILGWLHIANSVFALIMGALMGSFLLGLGVMTGEPIATRILALVGLSIGGFVALLAIPGIIAGIGLLRRRAWGRVLAMIVGALGLVNLPVGTAIGIYTFWVLLQDAATPYFAGALTAQPLQPAT